MSDCLATHKANLESWLATFEAYGAEFNNVSFVYSGHDSGITVRVTDPSKAFSIKLPKHVLLDFDRLSFCGLDGFAFNSDGLSDDLASAWIEIFSFVLSDERVNKLVQIFSDFHGLPDSVKNKLDSLGMAAFSRHETLPVAIAKEFLIRARYLSCDGKLWLLPLLEFVNHDPLGFAFDVSDTGVSVAGKTNDEIFVNYTNGDAFHYLVTYHFPARVNFAYSVPMKLDFQGSKIIILRSYLKNQKNNDGLLSPVIEKDPEGCLRVSSLMLGAVGNPVSAFKGFEKAWSDFGLSNAEDLYKAVYRTNVRWFVDFLRDLNGIEGLAADWLRQAAWQHLELMAEH